MENEESRRIAETLAHRASEGVPVARIADEIVSAWREIDVALTPIIGQRGVATLYKRSLYLTGSSHPWLAGLQEDVHDVMDLAVLKSVLAQQSSADAAAGGGALLQTFYELLTSLVGPSLTARLLRSVWAHSSSGSPAQDTSP